MKNQLEAAAIYATTSDADHWSPWRWSTLSAWLDNAVARVIYVIPFAGYFILYSVYFKKLFSFSTLNRSGLLTTIQRLDMSYCGSVALLVEYVL
jgi:hypothetical protein